MKLAEELDLGDFKFDPWYIVSTLFALFTVKDRRWQYQSVDMFA